MDARDRAAARFLAHAGRDLLEALVSTDADSRPINTSLETEA